MALDFPASPTNGQAYGAYVYDSSLPGWRSKGGAVAATYVSDTAPSGAVKGDMWYRSSDGTTYVYYVDADTSQWVEIRSEISTSKVGLVPIIPASVTVASGTASVAANGLITLSGVTGLTIPTLSSSFTNFKVVMNLSGSAAGAVYLRFHKNSTTITTGYYGGGTYVSFGGGTGLQSTRNNSSDGFLGFVVGGILSLINVEYKTTNFPMYTVAGYGGNDDKFWSCGYRTAADTNATGFYVLADSGVSFSGTIEVYGYN